MALNFLGLGFSFGAKDMGLSKVQQQVTAGFQGMNVEIDRLHETTKPAFNYVTDAMEGVDQVLARQQVRVGEWSQSFADAIDNVAAQPKKVLDAFGPMGQTLRSGAESIAFTWQNTFGKSFAAVGEKFEQLKWRISSVVAAADPITSKFRGIFKKGADGAKPMTEALGKMGSHAGGFAKKFGTGVVETLKKGAFFFKKRAADISRSQQVIADGFDSIKTVVHKMNQLLRVNKLRGFMEAISVGMLGKIAGGLQRIGTEGMNLTTGLEAQGVALAKQSKQTAVNLGLTGAELRSVSAQASGMALGLNIGAEQATQALVGFRDASSEFGLIGISSAQDLAKLTEVTGLSARDLSQQLKTMRDTFKLGDEDIQGIMSSFTSMGQVSRDVAGALQGMPEVMQRMSQQAELMGQNLDPRQLADFAKQSAALSAGLFKLTGNADQARSMSGELAGAMLGAQREFANLFAGTANDLPAFIKELAIMGGDVDEAFGLIQQGPAGFVQGLQMMIKNAEKSGANMDDVMNFMRARLEAAGITNTDVIASFLRTTDSEVTDVMESVKNATTSLGQLGREGFSTGRTLQESFDLAKDAAIAHFRAGGKAGTTFLKDFTESASKFNKLMDEISADGGPLGNFVDKLRDVHKLGAAGLLPKEMQGAGILLGEIISQLGPLLGLLGGAIMFFPGLTAVLGPVVTVLGLFAINLFKAKLAGESWSDAVSTAFDETLNIISKFVDYAKKAIPKVIDAVSAVIPDIIDAIMKAAPKLFEMWSKIQNAIVDGIVKYGPKLIDAFVKVVGKLVENFAKLAPKLINAFVTLVQKLATALPPLVPKLAAAFSTVLDAVINALVTLVPQIAGVIVQMIPHIVKALSDALPKIIEAIVKIAPSLITAFVDIIASLAKSLPDLLGKLIPAIIKGLEAILTAILQEAPRLLDALLSFIIGFAEKLPEMLPQLVNAIMDLLPKLIDSLSKMLVSLANAIPKILPPLLKAIVKGLLAIVDKLPTLIPALVDGLIAVFEAITKALPQILPELIKAMKMLIEGLVKALPKIIPALVKGIVRLLVAAIPMIAKALWEVGKQLWDFVFGGEALKMIWDLLVALVKGVWNALSDLFTTYIIEPLGDIWTLLEIPDIGEMFTDALKSIKDTSKKVWKAVSGFFDDYFYKPIKAVFDWFEEIWNWLFGNSWVLDTMTDVSKGIQKIWDTIKGILKEVFDFFKKTAKQVLQFVYNKFKRLFDFVKRQWDEFVEKAQEAWNKLKQIWTNAKQKLQEIFTAITDAGKKIWKDITDAAKRVWEDIKNAWGDVTVFFRNLFADVASAVEAPLTAMGNFIKGIWDDEKGGGIKGWWNKATKFFEDLWNDIKRIMEDIWGKIKEQVEEALGPLTELFEMLDGWIDTLFNNSIDDDIDESMSRASDNMQTHSFEMAKQFAQAMQSINDTAVSRFAQIESETDRFAKAELAKFEDFFDKLNKAFAAAFKEMDLTSSEMTKNLEDAISGVKTQMDEATRAFRQVRRMQGAVEAARDEARRKAEEEATEMQLATTAQLRTTSGDARELATAIHHPVWWRTQGKQAMEDMITELGLVVTATNKVVEAVKEVKTAVGRRQVGGRPATPANPGNPRTVR